MGSKQLIRMNGFLAKARKRKNLSIASGRIEDENLKLGKCSFLVWIAREGHHYGLIYSDNHKSFFFSHKGWIYNPSSTIRSTGEVISPLLQNEIRQIPSKLIEAMTRIAETKGCQHVSTLGKW